MSNNNWGGDRGPISPLARPTIKRITLTETAATKLRAEMLARRLGYNAAEASAYVSAGILAADDPRVVTALISDAAALLPWLETARRECFNEVAQRDLDTLMAAVWSAVARKR